MLWTGPELPFAVLKSMQCLLPEALAPAKEERLSQEMGRLLG